MPKIHLKSFNQYLFYVGHHSVTTIRCSAGAAGGASEAGFAKFTILSERERERERERI